MVSAVKWEGTSTSVTLHDTATSAAVNNDAISAASAEFDNSTTLATYGWLELTYDYTVAPSDTLPSLDIFRTEAPDGTNYCDAPLTGGAQQDQMRVASIPTPKNANAQRVLYGPIDLPPHKQKYYVDNQTGQTLPAGWGLKLFHNNIEGQ